MITGLGTDIIEIARVAEAFDKFGERYRRRVFTESEQRYCDGFSTPLPHYAARWAAKEALVKALGTGFSRGIRWVDIAVVPDRTGQPLLMLSGKAAEIARAQGVRAAHASLSHGRDYATATVILSDSLSEGALARFDPYLEVPA